MSRYKIFIVYFMGVLAATTDKAFLGVPIVSMVLKVVRVAMTVLLSMII